MKRLSGWNIIVGMAWLGLAGFAMANDPGELFPDVPFETESASDGSTTKDKPPPPLPKLEIILPVGKSAEVTPPADTPSPQTTQPANPEATPVPEQPAVQLPWFLTTVSGKETLDKIIADPKDGLKSAKSLAEGKTGAEAEEADLLLAIAEYVGGQNGSAKKRLEQLMKGTDKRRARAAVNYLEMMNTYSSGRYKNAVLADPNVLAEATRLRAGTLVQKAQDLSKKATKTDVTNLDSYNKSVETFVQAKAALCLGDYLVPDADHSRLAQEILKQEIGLRRRGIELILARADKRKERIDQIAGTMKLLRQYKELTNVWSPRTSALEVNAFVEAMLRDKKRAEELFAQIQDLQRKGGVQDKLGDLGERVANADKVKLTLDVKPGGRLRWRDFKRFANLYKMFGKDPGDDSEWIMIPDDDTWITVRPITPCPG